MNVYRAPLVHVRHHIEAVRGHEQDVERLLDNAEEHSSEIAWRRDRIEGHAVRAFVALLELLA